MFSSVFVCVGCFSAAPAPRSLWGPATLFFRPSSPRSAHLAQPTRLSPLGAAHSGQPSRLDLLGSGPAALSWTQPPHSDPSDRNPQSDPLARTPRARIPRLGPSTRSSAALIFGPVALGPRLLWSSECSVVCQSAWSSHSVLRAAALIGPLGSHPLGSAPSIRSPQIRPSPLRSSSSGPRPCWPSAPGRSGRSGACSQQTTVLAVCHFQVVNVSAEGGHCRSALGTWRLALGALR